MWLLLAAQVVLWHSYRGAEEQVLVELVGEYQRQRPDVTVELVAVPNDTFASKLNAAIPRGHGPDLFLYPGQDRIGDWVKAGLLAPLDGVDIGDLFAETQAPCRYDGHLYGIPLAFKSIALIYNKALVAAPPRTTDELIALGERLSAEGRYALVYESATPYYQAAWFFGHGAELLTADGRLGYDSPQAIASLEFLRGLQAKKEIGRASCRERV